MPIAAGAIGLSPSTAWPFMGPGRLYTARNTAFTLHNEMIVGVTRDTNGSPLGACVVFLFRSPSNALAAQTTSDSSGNYTFNNPGSGPFFIVSYKASAPDVTGATVNTITAV